MTDGTEVSSTIITASTSAMSEIVSSCVPALFIVPMTVTSPSLIGRKVTMPSMGAVTVVFESESRLATRSALVEFMRCSVAARVATAESRFDLAFW